MNLTFNNNGTYVNDTIVPNVTNSANLNQAIINMKIVNKKYNYCKSISQGKKTSLYSLNNKIIAWKMKITKSTPIIQKIIIDSSSLSQRNKCPVPLIQYIRKKKIYNERTKCNTVPSLNTHLLSPLQNKKASILKSHICSPQ